MNWTIDGTHTHVAFAVRHMAISTVRGRFGTVSGTAETGADGTLERIDVTIDARTIDTGEPQRDAHLRSADFLDVEAYPHITFRSTDVRRLRDGRYRITGDLTIRGQTRPVTFEAETVGPMTDPWGNRRAGATMSGTLSRKDFGLTWNQVLEFGGVAVGDAVRFEVDVEAVTQEKVTAQAR